jgi:hypothetical protein
MDRLAGDGFHNPQYTGREVNFMDQKVTNKNTGVGLGIALGAGVGTAFGLTVLGGNIAIGAGMGIGVGIVLGAIADHVRAKQQNQG